MTKAKPPTDYKPGFFTAPVRAWKQMRFVSAIRIDPRTKRFETDFARTQRHRANGGWDSHPCLQPGSSQYVQAGPVQMMEQPK